MQSSSVSNTPPTITGSGKRAPSGDQGDVSKSQNHAASVSSGEDLGSRQMREFESQNPLPDLPECVLADDLDLTTHDLAAPNDQRSVALVASTLSFGRTKSRYTVLDIASRDSAYTQEGLNKLSHLTLGDSHTFVRAGWQKVSLDAEVRHPIFRGGRLKPELIRALHDSIIGDVKNTYKTSPILIESDPNQSQGRVHQMKLCRRISKLTSAMTCELVALRITEACQQDRQIMHALSNTTLEDYLQLSPEDELAKFFSDITGSVPEASVDILRQMTEIDETAFHDWDACGRYGPLALWGVSHKRRDGTLTPTKQYQEHRACSEAHASQISMLQRWPRDVSPGPSYDYAKR